MLRTVDPRVYRASRLRAQQADEPGREIGALQRDLSETAVHARSLQASVLDHQDIGSTQRQTNVLVIAGRPPPVPGR